jgi:hypothetical protein
VVGEGGADFVGVGAVRADGFVGDLAGELVPHGGTPPGYRFLHNLPNKPLTGPLDLQDLENKGDSLQDLLNNGVMVSLELISA